MQPTQNNESTPGAGRWLVSKTEFAKMRGITASRVSQLIADKRLHGSALVGEGVRARIDVETANEQLGGSLDPLQQIAQGRPVDTGLRASAFGHISNDNQRILQAKALQAEISVRQAQREEMERTGVYCLAEDAKRAWSREMADLLTAIESWMTYLGAALSRDMGIDQKQATILLRSEWRAFRTRRADLATSAAAELPDLVPEQGGSDV